MIRKLFIRYSTALCLLGLIPAGADAETIPVKNNAELKTALTKVRAGDSIVLESGNWKDVALVIEKGGTSRQQVVIASRVPGAVVFTGNSFLRFGADYVTVSGIRFENGFAENGAVVEFRVNDKKIANNCRLTNSGIENFSKPGRFDGDSWIIFWGKNNRLDHCIIGNKYNSGTTLIVNLNDERSRQNRHSIDSNYFRGRSPLGSNGGESIRVGVSRYSLTDSETRIHHNYFERCSGEVEIVSLKSGKNEVSDNTFYECQGGLVLRHGSENVVSGNVFIGNGKPFTGGVRVINPGHKVFDNLFLELAGERFHSSFSLVNGVPNSAINRYLQVKDASIYNNTFVDCASILFGAGKDPERTAAPVNVTFRNNFIRTKNKLLFEDLNNDGGIRFTSNSYNAPGVKTVIKGFVAENTGTKSIDYLHHRYQLPVSKNGADYSRLAWMNAKNTGADWYVFELRVSQNSPVFQVFKKDAGKLNELVRMAVDGTVIELADTGRYELTASLVVAKQITLKAKDGLAAKPELVSVSEKGYPAFVLLENGADLTVKNLKFISAVNSFAAIESAIVTTTAPMNRPYRITVDGCDFTGFNETGSACIRGTKSTYAESVSIRHSRFIDCSGAGIDFSAEREDKGIYNVEYLSVVNTLFSNMMNTAINVYRGGNDESTTGPTVEIDHCTFNEVENRMQGCVVKLFGVQNASVTNTIFYRSGAGGRSIWFEEMAWDKLKVDYCSFYESGRVSAFFNKLNTTQLFKQKPVFRNPEQSDFRLTGKAVTLVSKDGKPLGIL